MRFETKVMLMAVSGAIIITGICINTVGFPLAYLSVVLSGIWAWYASYIVKVLDKS